MKDSVTIKHGYSLNLDVVQVGMVIGIMRHSDGSLHYYLDGVDQGEACSQIPEVVYPAIDLYGQCVQVSVLFIRILEVMKTLHEILNPIFPNFPLNLP